MNKKKININEVKENLCYYDTRHPDNQLEFRTKNQNFDKSATGECYCDNCFYGRTKLANIILDLLEDE